MKRIGSILLLCVFASLFAGEKDENVRRVCRFLKEAKFYTIATSDNGQLRVRPFGTIHVFEGKLYIQTGKKKAVFQQIMRNPQVALCAVQGNRWIRVYGKLKADDRRAAKASMLEAYPELRKMYSADDGNTQVLYFTEGTAEIHHSLTDHEVLKF